MLAAKRCEPLPWICLLPKIKGATKDLPQASIVFDRFHIAKKMNEAVDEIRRKDQREYKTLTSTRYLWLRNKNKLSEEQQLYVECLAASHPNVGTAYRLKEQLHAIFNNAQTDWRIAPLRAWMKQARKSNLKPIIKFVEILDKHWYGVKSYFKQLATNAFAERVNLKIQEIKRSAKGYRNLHNFSIMIYFHLGGLDFKIH
ncbi:MAG: transposase [Saprospiraceae bacterium]